MVRVGGMTYSCTPGAPNGQRISDMRLDGKPLKADATYKVAGWASVAENVSGTPIWDVMETYFRAHPVIQPRQPNRPSLIGVTSNSGLAEA